MEPRVKTNLPPWLKIRHRENSGTNEVAGILKNLKLHSVCQSAHCPNRSECWAARTASFMVMGEYCTRSCRFCAVRTLARPPPLDSNEPVKLAKAIASLGLKYVVITSVTRDDLPDQGAGHIAECVRSLRGIPGLIIETLVPDFRADEDAILQLVQANPDVISHNIETVERLTPLVRDKRAGYRQSLETLRLARELSGGRITTKSGLMLGFGEKEEEVVSAMMDLRSVGVDILTIGQYLAPSNTNRHIRVREYVEPLKFEGYQLLGYSLGFLHVASGPFVRSSYRASESFITGAIQTITSR
ncbi:MAG: lipoyl synthase [Candidatus Micrarchaeota archaeon]